MRRHVDAVELLRDGRESRAHYAARVHEDDLLVEIGKTPLMGDQLRVEGAGPVARDRQRHLRHAGQDWLHVIRIYRGVLQSAIMGLSAVKNVDFLRYQQRIRARRSSDPWYTKVTLVH